MTTQDRVINRLKELLNHTPQFCQYVVSEIEKEFSPEPKNIYVDSHPEFIDLNKQY